MKKRFFKIMALALMIFTLLSCQKEKVSRVGLNSEFRNNSQGLTILEVNRNMGNLLLSGKVFVNEGAIEINLINPEGTSIYQTTFSAPGLYMVHESFVAIPGFWRLSYKSHSGSGSISLYLAKNNES